MSESRAFQLDGRPVPYRLRVSARARWMRAELVPGEGLVVVLPCDGSEKDVEAFLRRHTRWLTRGLRRLARLAAFPRPALRHGTTVPFLGEDLRLDLNVGPEKVARLGPSLVVHVPRRTPAAVRRALQAWYMREGERELGDRATALARRHGLVFRRLAVRDPRRLWGSCSPTGALSFNWRLLLGPPFVVDYLVAHELAHLDVRGHGPAFRTRVETLCPGWRDAERWLRRHGAALTL
ncbi:MAG TPA: SprT family zinc-dependent metalloprotease [Planctomycetota bacterium]|nr:SprT family zinc-dependent metalloprotease [Planctomycetota bacterium]